MSGCNIGIYTNPDSLYVGIGTTVPNYTLDVKGNVNIQGTVYQNGAVFAGGDTMPVGAIMPFYASTVSDPSWLICDGATYNRADYVDLANALGVSPSATTFTVPDLRDKFLKGKNSDSVGDSGGSATTTLSVANLPNHTHTGTTDGGGSHSHTNVITYQAGAAQGLTYDGGINVRASSSVFTTSTAPDHTHTFTTSGTTGATSTPFTNLPPYTTVIYIIKAKNAQYITPIRNGDYWTSNTTNGALIYQSGKIGIGTTNPQEFLDVSGNVNITGSIKATNMNMFRNKVINGDMRLDSQNNGGIVGVSGTAAMNTTSTDKWTVATGQYSPSIVAQQVALSAADQATTGHTYAVSVSPANQPFGLSAYFSFEGNLKDASGNGVALAPVGNMLYVPGRVGSQCLYLANEGNVAANNSPNNYITSSYTFSSLFSIAFWVQCSITPSPTNQLTAFFQTNQLWTTNGVYVGWINGNVQAGFAANNATNISYSSTLIKSWTHIVVVLNGSTLTLYVNGSSSSPVTGTLGGTGFIIGSGGNTSSCMAGYIDDFRIYNRTLTATEIAALAAMTPFQPTLPATNTLTSYFPLDGNLNDMVAGNNLTATGTPVFQAGGVVGSACVYFPNEATVGTATPSVNYASGIIPTVSTTGPVTLCCWLNTTKMTANASYSPVAIAISTSTSSVYSICIFNSANTSTYGGALYNGTTYFTTPTTSLSINTWYFMTVVWISNVVYFYVNGSFISSVATSGTLPSNTRYLNFAGGAVANNSWAGYIDDVRVFNGTALAPSQIAAIYYSTNAAYANFQQQIDGGQLTDFQWGTAAAMPATLTAWLKNNTAVAQSFSLSLNSTGLIGYLPLDNSYTDAAGAGFLSAPRALSATTFSNSVFKVGTYALSVNANTIGSAAVASVDYSVPSYIPLPLSVSLWFNATTTTGASQFQNIANFRAQGTYALSIIFSGTSLYAEYYVNGVYGAVVSSIYPAASNWYNITLVLSSNRIYLYLNGIQTGESSFNAYYLLSGTSSALPTLFSLGNRGDGNSPFKGYIDDVRIYNRALTAAQVKALYDANSGANGTNTTAPTATTITLPVRNLTYNTPSIPANTWQQIQLTVPADSTGAWETRPGQPAATLALCLGAGSAYSNVSTNTWTNNTEYIGGTTQLINNSATGFLTASSNAVLMTGVQLEKGALATGYEIRPVGIEGILTRQQLAFVIGPSTTTNWATPSQVKGFDTYIIDINCRATNSFNTTSGYFTCQIPGLYFFSVNLYGSGSANFWMRKNASSGSTGIELTGTQTNSTMETCTTVVSLGLNDTVSIWVRNIVSGVIQTTYGPNTTFQGYLISS